MRESLVLLAILAVVAGSLIAFSALDRRTPNDHDTYFTAKSLPALVQLQAPEVDRVAVLTEHFLTGGPHPRLPQTVLLIASGTAPSRQRFRLANLPFVVLLVLGSWLLGRQLGGARVGVAAAALTCTFPLMLNHSHKFIPNWHGAALTPLAWALLLMAWTGRGRGAWAAAIGAGIVQAARCYCHPVVLPDVALSTALVVGAAAWQARDRTWASAQPLLRVGTASALAVLLTSHILGWTAGWLGEPGYSLAKYRASKSDVVGEWSAQEAATWIPAAGRYLSEMATWHLFPTGFALLALGVIATGVAARRGDAPAAVGLLGAAFLLQAPLAILTLARGTFTADWTVLLPGLGAIAAWGVWADASPLREPIRRAWGGLLGAHVAFVVLVPLALPAPSPLEDPQWWAEGIPAWFARSSTGTVWNTHHIPLRHDLAGESLAEALASSSAPGLEVADLRYRGADASVPCRPAGSADGGWVWGAGDEQTARREWGPWPAAFRGRGPIVADFTRPDERAEAEGTAPRRGGPMLVGWTDPHRPVLVRLWVELTDAQRTAWASCQPSWGTEALAASARAVLEAEGLRTTAELRDFGGELVGLENEYDREPTYLSRALLLLPSGSPP